MDIEESRGKLRIYRAVGDDGSETELAGAEALSLLVNDLVGLKLTGELPAEPDYRKVNFAQSTLLNVSANSVDFSECDFKDCLIKNAVFRECNFDGGMFATSFFSATSFLNCTFYNLAAHNSDFHDTDFVDCDLTNLLVKSSKFRRCTFRKCKTSNKIAEMSVLDETSIIGTEIQINTITENFGLRIQDLEDSAIRSGRIREDYRLLSTEDLRSQLNREDLSALAKLRLSYFLSGHLLDGSDFLDRSLDLGSWIKMYQNPSTFVELLDRFSEFLVNLYDSGKVPLHPLLLLHFVTSRLTNSKYFQSDLLRVAQSLGGTHLILSRIVEEYLEVLDALLLAGNGRLRFLAEGSEKPEFYENELQHWLSGTAASVVRVVPHNSPYELEIVAETVASLLPIMALFLATRTRLEILRYRPPDAARAVSSPLLPASPARTGKGESESGDPEGQPAGEAQARTLNSLFLLDIGLPQQADRSYQFQLRSILPGSLLFDLRLNVSTCLVGRIRKVLVDLMEPSVEKNK